MLEELKIRIVSVLGSEKNGCTENDLCRLYRIMYSKDLRPCEYGFADLKSLLNSTVMQGQGGIVCRGGRYFAAGDENTAKILELVRQTKSKKRPRPLKAAVAGGGHRPSIMGVVSFRHAVTTNKRFVPKNQVIGRKPAGENAIARQRPKTQSQYPNRIAKFAPVVNMGDTLIPQAAQLSQASNNSFAQLMDKAVKPPGQDNKHFAAYPSSSGVLLQVPSTRSIEGDVAMKTQKGRKRFEKLIERFGGEMSFSELKCAYNHQYQVPLDNAEICRIFGAANEKIQNQYDFFKSHLEGYFKVTKQPSGDLWLASVDDEDDIENESDRLFAEFENLGVVDMPARRIPSLREVQCFDSVSGGYDYPNRTTLLSPSAGRSGRDAQPNDGTVERGDDRLQRRNGSSIATTIRPQGDYLSYKVLGDKVLGFVRARGSLKINDLSRVFFEEDGRHIDPVNYPEGSWENIINKVLSIGGHQELIVQGGLLNLRERVQKSAYLPMFSATSCAQSDNRWPVPRSGDSVPADMIYDVLVEAGRPLLQKELLEKLNARGIMVNSCQLTLKLITQFQDVFCCEFEREGAVVSLERNARRPGKPAALPRLPLPDRPIRITAHVMSDYCSIEDSADSLFKPILLVNVELVDEPPSLRIQAYFRLRSLERTYNLFEEEMYHHYGQYGQNTNFAVDRPVEGDNYVLYSAAKGRAYRVQCLGEGDSSTSVPVYLVDQLRHEEVPVTRLKMLISKYARPAYGVIVQTAPFRIVPGRESEFHLHFSRIRAKLLQNTKADIRAYVDSVPSKGLFELKQLYFEAYNDLKVPAKFLRENLITMFSPQSAQNGSQTSLANVSNNFGQGKTDVEYMQG